MLHSIIHAIIDSIKLVPFLYITYLLMEFIEHKVSKKNKETIKKSGKLGPMFGSLFGVFPQCGFSVAATNLYAGRVITLGTLISVYLSTSDEMLPIFISEMVPAETIVKILFTKFAIGMIAGFIIDFALRMISKDKEDIKEEEKISEICEHDHCHCEKSIWKSALKHTANIFIFILVISIVINIAIHIIGEEKIAEFIQCNPLIGPLLAGLIGLIPNCAASVIITKLYLGNLINVATMITGLLVSAGAGLAVLFKANKDVKENMKIVALLYGISVVVGLIIQMIGIQY